MIEDSWEDKRMFKVYPPRQPEENDTQEGGGSEKTAWVDPDALPDLSLDEVLVSSKTETEQKVRKNLYESLGAVTYQSWFHSAGFEVKAQEGGGIDFSMATRFAREYVLTHYGKTLKKAFEAVFGSGVFDNRAFDFEGC
jgi:hypothetical protein